MDALEISRKQIDQIDKQLLTLFGKRFSLVKKIGDYKKKNNIPIPDREREDEKLQKLIQSGRAKDVSEPFITAVWKTVFLESYRLES